ncbi:MAG TPA: hypothetical protein D7I11_01545 [Candidatus Poseidoniales archaeon]|nr:hypothetical protein [Euryarchaeota archaeon]DAC56087.1 MAG TPA: hypothetical protein D7I11_01545 [Candidatus Poseidoniales archaeon]|tara:strand:+ start:216 stop:1127 length:912 start_codon:yes stop_codon:yes gene_type:complete
MVRPQPDLPDVRTAQPEPVQVVTSFEEFRRFMQRDTPCVYSGSSLYSFQDKLCEPWLRKHAGQSKVCVRRSPTGKFIDPSDGVLNIAKSLAETNISLNEFLDNNDSRMLLSGTDTYVYTKNAVVGQWSELWAHASEVIDEHGGGRSLIPQSALSTVGLWLSRDGVQSMTHYDDSLDHNLNFQIKGKKEILMFPPEDWKHLKTFKAMSMQPFSFFEGIKKGHMTSTQQRNCQPQWVELNEGDVLYIPSGWFHFVEHIDDLNINLTYWFKTGRAKNELKKPKQSLRNILIPLKLSLAFLLSHFAS